MRETEKIQNSRTRPQIFRAFYEQVCFFLKRWEYKRFNFSVGKLQNVFFSKRLRITDCCMTYTLQDFLPFMLVMRMNYERPVVPMILLDHCRNDHRKIINYYEHDRP